MFFFYLYIEYEKHKKNTKNNIKNQIELWSKHLLLSRIVWSKEEVSQPLINSQSFLYKYSYLVQCFFKFFAFLWKLIRFNLIDFHNKNLFCNLFWLLPFAKPLVIIDISYWVWNQFHASVTNSLSKYLFLIKYTILVLLSWIFIWGYAFNWKINFSPDSGDTRRHFRGNFVF